MNNNEKLIELINFLKENRIGLSEEEIKSTYNNFLLFQSKNKTIRNEEITNFIINKFGDEWTYLDNKLKKIILKYLTDLLIKK